MKLQFYTKHNYGTEMAYPLSKELIIFMHEIGQKTLTSNIFRALKALGYELEEVLAPREATND